MKLKDIEALLDQNGFHYEVSVVENAGEFYRSKGFLKTKAKGSFCLLTIPNPHHNKHIEFIFKDAKANPDFEDLEFGGYWYELFDCTEEHLPHEILKEINDIISGRVHIIFAKNAKTLAWFFDGAFFDSPEEEFNDMDEFHALVQRIKKPKSWWRKLRKRTDLYEIYNWESYESIIK